MDVMDGAFVPSISFGMPVIKSLRPCTRAVFDVHMMVEEPGRYVEDMKDCGADIITVQAEACTHLDRVAVSYTHLDVYKRQLEQGAFVHLVLNQALQKYQYLGKADRDVYKRQGVAGVAWPTFISRVTAAFMMFVLIQNRNNTIRLNSWKFLIPDRHMIKNILSIGIPNGLENGMFQFGKIFLQSLVSSLGTVSIALSLIHISFL